MTTGTINKGVKSDGMIFPFGRVSNYPHYVRIRVKYFGEIEEDGPLI